MRHLCRRGLQKVVPFLLVFAVAGECAWIRSLFASQITDARGSRIEFREPPQRVVSLVPGVSQMLFGLGVGDVIIGRTWRETYPPETAGKTVVGGLLTPSVERIAALDPDVIFLSPQHQAVRVRFEGTSTRVVEFRFRSIKDIYRTLEELGAVFKKSEQATQLVMSMQGMLELVSRKIEKIPSSQRLRVLRFMGEHQMMTPGDDSFQNEFIRAAGGIAPRLGKFGEEVPLTLEEWQAFNPQAIYGCEEDREAAKNIFNLPGWKDVDAVREGRIFYFPCELASQASVHSAYFIAWLASSLYKESFSAHRILKERPMGSQALDLPLEYVASARVVESTVYDFPNKTLLIELRTPMRVLSTLEGERKGIRIVGNHSLPPPCWNLRHRGGVKGLRDHLCAVLGVSPKSTSLLMTGAKMDNLVVRSAHFKEMAAYALVTAGVRGNAVRMGWDEGRFYEPGTINILILTNRRLTSRARARAIIAATEAKTAALQDLDIRSTANPLGWQATGTGTDEMIVLEGGGKPLDNTGGHSKMGELIARAVYEGVREAVYRQNGIMVSRDIFSRLLERGIWPRTIVRRCSCRQVAGNGPSLAVLAALEEFLMNPRYAAFIEAALVFSDAHERGQVHDLEPFRLWARAISDELAGRPIGEWKDLVMGEDIPVILRIALNAVLNGAYHKVAEARPESVTAIKEGW